MAQKFVVERVDDLDGSVSEGISTVTFGLDGASYEIDLNEGNAERLRESLARYLGAARSCGLPVLINIVAIVFHHGFARQLPVADIGGRSAGVHLGVAPPCRLEERRAAVGRAAIAASAQSLFPPDRGGPLYAAMAGSIVALNRVALRVRPLGSLFVARVGPMHLAAC